MVEIKRKVNIEISKEFLILGISILSAILINFVSLAIFGLNIVTILYIVIISLTVAVVPYFFFIYREAKITSEKEEYFPGFLRDLAESQRVGLSMTNAIASAANSNYGPLTKDIIKVNQMLSWGIPFPDAIKSFSKSVKQSYFMRRGLAIVMEAFYTGGNLTGAMDSIADSTTILKDVEKDKVSILQEQMMIMYIIHFLFVGIIVALYKILIPLLTVQQTGGSKAIMELGQAPEMQYFKILFLITISIQSFCNAFVAGEASEGKVSSGFKHISLMLGGALLAYAIFILPTSFSLSVTLSRENFAPGEKIALVGSVFLEEKVSENAVITAKLMEQEVIGQTNKEGKFELSMIAPETPGLYSIIIKAEKDELIEEKELKFLVKKT